MRDEIPQTHITFHYLNGSHESFQVFNESEDPTPQGMQLELRHFLQKDWWIVNLPEQTIMINAANVVKVEMKPPMTALHGEGVFSRAERITALNRSRLGAMASNSIGQ